jgi:VCBS repeat-containing protein
VAKNDEYRVLEKQITVNVLANDTDPNCDRLWVISLTQGSYGNATINPDGTITYIVTTATSDSFTYTISDGKGGSAQATVTVTD